MSATVGRDRSFRSMILNSKPSGEGISSTPRSPNHRSDGSIAAIVPRAFPSSRLLTKMKVFRFGPAAWPSAIKGFAGSPGIWVLLFDPVVWLERLYRLLVFPAGFQEEPSGNQVSIGPTTRQRHLLANRWHGIPGVEYVRNLVTGKAVEIIRPQPVAVPHFHAIRPALWK